MPSDKGFQLLAAGCVVFFCCNSTELNRSRATQILNQVTTDEFPRFHFQSWEPISLEACKQGAEKGYWRWEYERGGLANAACEEPNNLQYHSFQLTPKGMKVFTSGPVTAMRNGRLTTEYEDGIPQRGVMPGRYGIRLRQPVRKKILEVTGITAGPADNVKLAEFTWKWDFSHLSKGIDSTTATGVAVFHRYDDGWRIDVTSTKFLDAKLIIRE